jgi:hypothetical protein
VELAHYQRLLRDRFCGQRAVLVGVSRTRLRPLVRSLAGMGARGVFALSCNADGEEPADSADTRWWSLRITGHGQRELDERFDAALLRPAGELLHALDAFDPAREAWVLDSRDLPGPTFAGRRRFGWRRPAWARAEDKVWVGEVWRRAGIEHAAAAVVPATPEAVVDAARRLDTGTGTVWAADARDGLHAGAEGTRWVRDEAQAANAITALLPRCDRVRIMPYLNGMPCSIHGLVCGDGVVALRPLELLTLRRPDGRFVFAGTSTLWDCPDEATLLMREVTRRIGAALRELLDYRGGFTVDGVLTGDAFLPTEVNARLGSGLNIDRTTPELGFFLLNRVLQEDGDADVRPALLERLVNEALHEVRAARAKVPLARPASRYTAVGLRLGPGGWVSASSPAGSTDGPTGSPAGSTDGPTGSSAGGTDAPDAVLVVAESDKGDEVALLPHDPALRGAALAPLAVEAFAFAQRTLGVDIGPLRAAAEPL